MRFFVSFFISQRIELKFNTGIQNSILILIFGAKSGLGDNFGQYDKNHYLSLLFGQMPPGNSAAMATPMVPGDPKLFERV